MSFLSATKSHRVRRNLPLVKHQGFALLELVIAVSLSALLGIYATAQMTKQSQESLAEASATYIALVAGAAERHTLLNFNEYANTIDVPGVAVDLRPTVAELVTLGRLNAGFPTWPGSMPTRQELRVDVTKANCPGANCTLTTLVCTTTPVTLGAADIRFDLASTMVEKQGGSGGQSLMNNGATIRGPVLNVANPLGNIEGIVCGSSVVDTALYQRFVKIQDTRNPDLQGPLSVAGPVNFAGNLAVVGTGTAGSFLTTGTSTAGKVQLTDITTVNTACPTDGLLAKDATGQLLTCQSNVWKLQGDGRCVLNNSDLNFLQEDGRCYNGAGNTNSPAGADWFFVEVYRHVNPANFYTVQRAYGMTGTSAGKAWMRNQQSAVSGTGWSAWALTSARASAGDACSPNGTMATSASGISLLCVSGIYQGMDTIIRGGTPYTACSAAGTTAIDTANSNEVLICRMNLAGGGLRYMRLRDVTQHLIFVRADEVGDGSTVGKPTCSPASGQTATQIIQLIPKTMSTTDGGIAIYAVDNGGSWTTYLRNGSYAPLSGNPTAIAQIFCYFP